MILCISFVLVKNKVMGLNIKRTIKEHGLEVREVARRMQITPTGLSQHITGNPSVEVLERIATAIGCDVSELFEVSNSDKSMHCPNCGVKLKLEKEE